MRMDTQKYEKNWVACDICDEWTCIACIPNDFDVDKEYICSPCCQ